MRYIIIIIIGIIGLSGCADDTTNPVAPGDYSVSFLNLPDSLIAIAGDSFEIPISALVRDSEGIAAPGVRVEFAVASGSGSFDSPGLTSDQHGRVEGFATVTPSEGWSEFTAMLFVPGGEASASISLRGVKRPHEVRFNLPSTTFTLHDGQSLETTFTAVIVDSLGRGVAGMPVEVRMNPVENDPFFGSMTAPRFADENGAVEIAYNSGLGRGKFSLIIDAVLPGGEPLVSDTAAITVRPITAEISSLTVRAIPNLVFPEPDELGYSIITAVVRDNDLQPMEGIEVRFYPDLGIMDGKAYSDSMGRAIVWWNNNYMGGNAHILATIPGTEHEATAQVYVSVAMELGTLTLQTDKREIFVSNGLDTAWMTAVLKDGSNQARADEELIFTSTHGAVISPVRTNAHGMARVPFIDTGRPSLDPQGNPVPAKIYVKFPEYNLIDSVEVTIAARNPITQIAITCQKNQMTAASRDSSWIRATATHGDGTYAQSGLLFHWEIWRGENDLIETFIDTSEAWGRSEYFFIPQNRSGTYRLIVWIENEDGSKAASNELEIQVLPGPPHRINLTAFPNEIDANDPDQFSIISAEVSDTFGNPVRDGILVRFRTTLGGISPTDLTDEEGIATVRLTPALASGTALVTASIALPGGDSLVATTTVLLNAGMPNQLHMTVSPDELEPFGPSGPHATYRVVAYDAFGNLLSHPATIIFQLLNQPEPPNGCSFPNNTLVDSNRTSDGIAYTTLRPGWELGNVMVKAYTWKDSLRTDTVSVVNSRLLLISGPPAAIDIDCNSQGIDAGGGTWQVEVSARVYDYMLNPVRDDIPVSFTVQPDDIATITHGRTVNGIATAQLFYHSLNTNEPIIIQATVQVPNGEITADREWQLPLQQGRLELHADPANWQFARGEEEDTCQIRVWAVLHDGHGIAIQKSPILFNSTHSRYYWRDQVGGRWRAYFPNPVRKYTGDGVDGGGGDEIGFSTVYLRGPASDFFPDDEALETTVTLNAEVEGEGVEAEPVRIRISRQDGQFQGNLMLQSNVDNWAFDIGNPDDTCQIMITALLTDFFGNPVNGESVWFSTNRGRLYWRDQVGGRMRPFFPAPARAITGLRDQNHDEAPGTVTVYLRGPQSDFYDDDEQFEATAAVSASVDGQQIVAEPLSFVFVRR